MQLENRYLVIKRADAIKNLTKQEHRMLLELADKSLSTSGQPIQAVVIESDWPEYNQTIELLANRIQQEKKLKEYVTEAMAFGAVILVRKWTSNHSKY